MNEREQFEQYSHQFLAEIAARPEGKHPPSQVERIHWLAKEWLFGRETKWIMWEKTTESGAIQKRLIHVGGDVFIDAMCAIGRRLDKDSRKDKKKE